MSKWEHLIESNDDAPVIDESIIGVAAVLAAAGSVGYAAVQGVRGLLRRHKARKAFEDYSRETRDIEKATRKYEALLRKREVAKALKTQAAQSAVRDIKRSYDHIPYRAKRMADLFALLRGWKDLGIAGSGQVVDEPLDVEDALLATFAIPALHAAGTVFRGELDSIRIAGERQQLRSWGTGAAAEEEREELGIKKRGGEYPRPQERVGIVAQLRALNKEKDVLERRRENSRREAFVNAKREILKSGGTRSPSATDIATEERKILDVVDARLSDIRNEIDSLQKEADPETDKILKFVPPVVSGKWAPRVVAGRGPTDPFRRQPALEPPQAPRVRTTAATPPYISHRTIGQSKAKFVRTSDKSDLIIPFLRALERIAVFPNDVKDIDYTRKLLEPLLRGR